MLRRAHIEIKSSLQSFQRCAYTLALLLFRVAGGIEPVVMQQMHVGLYMYTITQLCAAQLLEINLQGPCCR